MYMVYYSERREAIQVKRAGQLSFCCQCTCSTTQKGGKQSRLKKGWPIIFLLSNWSMLCYLETREAIQVKRKGLAFSSSAVYLVHALILREERSHPGKKGWPNLVLCPYNKCYFCSLRSALIGTRYLINLSSLLETAQLKTKLIIVLSPHCSIVD